AADFPEQAFILGLLKLLHLPGTDYDASARLLDAARQGINLAPGKYAWIEADVDLWRYLAYNRLGGESALERAQALREAHPGIVDSLRALLAD
ncbi:MAG: hypothetical protein KDD10_30630, partial [Phaeodactylibacter sp.]|nr:hypothetical protein [Phaeodactylibacter sp.]